MSQSNSHALAESNIHLVNHWVGRCKKQGMYRDIDPEELMQEGCLGLLRAAQLYDPHRNCQFSTYAAKWIRRYINRLGRKLQSRVDAPRDPILLDIDVLNAEAAHSLRPNDTFTAVIASETHCAVAASLNALDSRSQDVVLSRFGVGRKKETLRVIAVRHGITPQRVWQINQKALGKLKKSELLITLAIGN